MWRYNIFVEEIKNPTKDKIVGRMDNIGAMGWEIISVKEEVIEEWTKYGDEQIIIAYTFYVKILKESAE
jgi:hypothetical protein